MVKPRPPCPSPARAVSGDRHAAVFMPDLLGNAVTWVVDLINALGYLGLALVVALENVFP